jgi:4-amino-4-deoxy-L-arabinose transferase-like glycosyltransferase
VNARYRTSTDWVLLVGFCGFLFFFGLSSFGLIGADEPRYAQVAREMLARRDWITPTLSGQPWLEKPPLYYWQAMIVYRIFGVSDWAARLPSAIDASLLVIAIYFFLRRFGPGSELDGALMIASAAGVVGFARAASTDMPLAATFTIAMLGWYAWYETNWKGYLGGFYAFLALGTLAKGPLAGFLAAAVITLFAISKADYRIVMRTLWIPGLLLFCALSLPWYIGVQAKNPDFFRIFILQHNLARFGTNLYHHKEPFWYYVPVTLLGLVPWVMIVLAAIAASVRAWRAEGRKNLTVTDWHAVFLLIWLMVPVVFFSISQSKLPGYVLPALPAGTLLAVDYVRRRLESNERPSWLFAILHSMGASASLIPALMIQYILLQHRLPWSKGTLLSLAVALLLAFGMVVTLRTQLGLNALRFVTLIPVVLSVGALLRLGSPAVDSTLSARPIAREIGQLENKPMPLAVYHISREIQFGLAFYRNQVIDRYESGEIPQSQHLVVAPEAHRTDLEHQLPGRRISYLGSFAPQGLDYYWVAEQP